MSQPTSQDLAQQQELLRQQQHGLLQRMPLQSRPPAQAAWQTVKTSWLQNTPNTTVNSTSPTNGLSPNASGDSNAATAIGNDALLDRLALTDFAEVHLCYRQSPSCIVVYLYSVKCVPVTATIISGASTPDHASAGSHTF